MIHAVLRNPDSGIRYTNIKIFMICIQSDPHPAGIHIILNSIFYQVRYSHGKISPDPHLLLPL